MSNSSRKVSMRSLETIKKARTLKVRDTDTDDGMDISLSILPERFVEVVASKVYGGVPSPKDTIQAIMSYSTAQAYLALLVDTLDEIDDEYSKKYGLREIENGEQQVNFPALAVKVVGFIGE